CADLGDGQNGAGMLRAGVGAHTAGPGNVSQAAHGTGVVTVQHRGAGEPVIDPGVAQCQLGDFGEVSSDRLQLLGGGQPVQRYAAGVDSAAQQPMPGHRRVDAQQLFADALGVGVGDAEADVVGQRAQIGGVVVEPFEFDEQGPQPL